MFKFRAFDFTTLQMNYKVLVGNTDETDENYTCSLVWSEQKNEWLHFDKHCGVISQFIGLKDKKGEDIYVGDILQIWGKKYVIENNERLYIKDLDSCKYYCVYDFQLSEFSEVIGNIWQNKELLN